MKSRRRQYIAYVVLATALMAAFQNCGPLSFLPLTSAPMQSSLYTDGFNSFQSIFKDSHVGVGPDSFTLYESSPSPTSSVSVTLMPGAEAQSIPVTYTLYLVESSGNLNLQTPLGTFTGTNTLNSVNGISSFTITLNATQAQVTAAKNANATLVVEIKKSFPTETNWRLPVNIVPNVVVADPPVDPPPVDPPPPTDTPEQRRARCRTYTNNPAITNLSSTSVTNQYGQSGDALEGNINSPAVKVDFNRSIANQSGFDTDGCLAIVRFRTMCNVVKGDAVRPLSITHAISRGGEDRLAELRAANKLANPTKPDAQIALEAQQTIADGSFTGNNCNVQFNQGSTQGEISIRPNYNANNNGGFRCVQGSYWMSVVLRSEIDGQPNKDSAPQYIQVTTNNGCWKEYRLKDVNNVNPRIPNVANLGSDVVINGNWAVGLAESENDEVNSINKVGALYLWKKDGANWVYKQKVMIPQSLANEAIQAVAIRGDYMVVGNPNKGGSGAIYMYTRGANDVWSMVGSAFTSPDAGAGQRFGRSIALCATKVFVGAPGARTVHVFGYDGSGILSAGAQKINNNSINNFGQSVACNPNYFAIGAPGSVSQTGQAFVYNYATLALVKSYSGEQGAQFGYRVAIRDTRLAVYSDSFGTDASPEQGRVSYFADFTAALTTPTRVFSGGATSARLGSGMAMSTTGLYIGTPQNGSNTGVVTYHTFTELENSANAAYRIRALNESANSRFGYSINVDGSNVIIGARTQMIPGDNNGAAYIYEAK